jgi:son of sevenless-like protein
MKFNIQLNMEQTRSHMETRAIQERDKAELRDLLEYIVQSHDDMIKLMQHPQQVENVMETLQNVRPSIYATPNTYSYIHMQELRESTLEPEQEQNFRDGLWELHQRSSLLPPLEDCESNVAMAYH